MKLLAGLFLIVLMLASLSGAELEETPEIKDIYNYGDVIDIDYNIVGRTNLSGLFVVQLYCAVNNITYFASPIDVDSSPFTVDVPSIDATEDFIGTCNLRAHLLRSNGGKIESRESRNFNIGPGLDLQAELGVTEVKPGESLTIQGQVNPSYGDFDGTLAITFLGVNSVVDLKGAVFQATVNVGDKAKAGSSNVIIRASDRLGNLGEISRSVNILPVPSTLLLEVADTYGAPGDSIRYSVKLLDQAGGSIEGTAAIVIEGEKERFTHTATLSNSELFQIPQGLKPGDFVLTAISSDIEKSAKFEVIGKAEAVFDLKESRYVEIINTGNVDFDETLVVGLLSSEKSFTFSKKLSIPVGESQLVDLYEEAPTGSYTLSVKAGDTVATYDDVFVRDERGFGKRISGFLSAGDSEGAPGTFFKVLALAIVIAISFFAFKIAKKKGPTEESKPEPQQRPEPQNIDLTSQVKEQKEQERAEQIIEKKKQIEMTNQPSKKLDRDSPEVQKFLKNLQGDKPQK